MDWNVRVSILRVNRNMKEHVGVIFSMKILCMAQTIPRDLSLMMDCIMQIPVPLRLLRRSTGNPLGVHWYSYDNRDEIGSKLGAIPMLRKDTPIMILHRKTR